MRDRLLVAFVALTLGVIAAFLVLRGHAISEKIHEEQRQDLARSAEVMAGLLPANARDVSPEQLRSLLYDGERVNYTDADGHWVQASQHTTSPDEDTGDDLSVTRPVPAGGRVTLSLRADVVDQRVSAALLPLVLVSLGLAAVASLVALWPAARLSRPFRELAEVAEAIGRGEYDVAVRHYRIPEADAVARVLRTSAADLDVLTRRERDFAANASHALRTPITAARLELEDLAIAPETPPDVVGRLSDAVEQLDRLNSTVAGMLDAGRGRVTTAVDIDLAALVRDAAARWRRFGGRRISFSSEKVVPVRLPVGPLVQVMDALLQHAVQHGRGAVRVSVSEEAEYAEVRVSHEAPRDRAAGELRKGLDAAGLARAREIAESLGGRLRLGDDPTTTFSLVLPLPQRETVAP